MRPLRAWLRRLAGTVGGHRRDREFADELESHLQLHIDDNVRAGMSEAEARRQAVLQLGGVGPTREAYHDRATLPVVERGWQDLRFAARQLRRRPGFALATVLILGLGVATSATVFGVVDAALIQPLPYRAPSRLADVTESVAAIPRAALSYQDYLDWTRLNTVFSDFSVYTGTGFLLATPSGTQAVRGERVSAGFFHTLGVTPLLGRDFGAGERGPAGPPVVILGYGAWQRRFGGRTGVVGSTVTLDGTPRTVVGVLPPRFRFAPAGPVEIWSPMGEPNYCEQHRFCHNLQGVARLKDGVTAGTARDEMTGIAARLEQQYPESNRGQGASVMSLSEAIVGNVRPTLLALVAGAGLLLLIACVNVAGLLLVRTESRRRELMVRRALGASTGRLATQFVTEGLVLALAGGAAGMALAAWMMRMLPFLAPAEMVDDMPYLGELGLNAHVLLAVTIASLVAVVLFAAIPMVRSRRFARDHDVSERSRGNAGRTWSRLGGRLVALELAIAVVLLVGAGLLGRSLYRLSQVDLAFTPDRLATVQIIAPESKYASDAQRAALGREIVKRAAQLPGATGAGVTSVLPVSFNGNTMWIRVVGHPYHGEHDEVNFREVSPGYLPTLGTPLVRGRGFTETDDAAHPRVAIVNEALVRRYFAGEDPVGQRIGDTDLSPDSIREVVGVIADLREGPPDTPTLPAIYYPFSQAPESYFSLVVRAARSDAALLPTLDTLVHRIDPDLGTRDPATMPNHIGRSPAAYLHQSAAWMAAGFAAMAWMLGVMGLYGVLAYLVSQRTREIGIRMALGAEPRSVSRLVVREAGVVAAVGIGVGVVAAIGAAVLMRGVLFGTAPWDVPTLAAAVGALGASVLLASYVPARRAAAIDPIDALREE